LVVNTYAWAKYSCDGVTTNFLRVAVADSDVDWSRMSNERAPVTARDVIPATWFG
jgi:hypothetical protein